MPYRHWFVVVTVDGVESRDGPYATRRTAERKSEQHHPNAPSGAVKVVYDDTARLRRSGRDRTGAEMSISAKWYVLVTSPSKRSVFATTGPYPTEADAVQAADTARVPHYHVALSGFQAERRRRVGASNLALARLDA